MSCRIRAVFFDAGNTLLFPRLEVVARAASELGYAATVEDFRAAERTGKAKLDAWLWPQILRRELPAHVDVYFWGEYMGALFERLQIPGAARPEFRREVAERFRDITLWSSLEPSTAPYLESLRARGYILGVISNSIGTMEEQLERLGLAHHFRTILDSAVVGIEKPRPEVFALALRHAGVEASEALFVGDTYSTDVGGAQLAGLTGILMDRVGAYPDAECPRITSLPQLDKILAESAREAGDENEVR